MAHLIKLADYASRYEHDIQRYPSQFSRLKRERWHRMKEDWSRAARISEMDKELEASNWFEEEQKSFFAATVDRLKRLTIKKSSLEIEEEEEKDSLVNYYHGKSLDELKELFYEELYQAQLHWASTSLLEESELDSKYYYDQRLRYLLRELPDNYMVLYYPIVVVEKAPVEMEIILLSPTEIFTVSVLEGKPNSVFSPDTGRYWTEFVDEKRKRVINPLISLNRMTRMVRDLLEPLQVSLPVQRVLLSPQSLIDYHSANVHTETVDKRNHQMWLDKMKRQPSPIKKVQLEVAEKLLRQSFTTSSARYNQTERNPE
ncbi:nuclease-related domain-containing protein [Bacillus piscicola]|uniref:nuclease-related domain-containing protein n=1 Tax=Bacillus piscicola TaxID=1632684 RepID=UPI001F09773E|nr:NERD domain-containing protein [Bacillus piscicola]